VILIYISEAGGLLLGDENLDFLAKRASVAFERKHVTGFLVKLTRFRGHPNSCVKVQAMAKTRPPFACQLNLIQLTLFD
jgi:hypothetical protein